MKEIKSPKQCEHKGCPRTNPPHTLFDAGKGLYCAEHFGGEQNVHRQAAPEKTK